MNDQAKTLGGALNAYDDAPVGTRFPVFSSHIDQARQAHYHQTTDISGALFDGLADVSIFAQDVSRAVTMAGLPNDGRVLVCQRLFQTGRIRLGEALSVEGEIGPYGEGPRGRYLTCHVAFRRANGTVPLRMATEHLLPYDETPAVRKKTAAAKRDDPRLGMQSVGNLKLNPEKVMGYAKEVGNKIHSDPVFARSRGYRAPLAQGLMQLTALHGVIVQRAMPWEMDLETRFLRPVFWDDQLTLYSDPAGRLYRCIDQDGKMTAEAKLHHLTTRDMEP
ncbi:MAG: MaoC family dehydratase [Proteobacteria bacterium]|nr:MaoC family dehydratase [Pseudomonadota bacterium]